MAVVARFDPAQHERVRTLLAAGPPFDPAEAGLERHVVYLSAREAVFVFEGPHVDWEVEELADDVFHPELRELLGEWRELLAEDPRVAHEVFAWELGGEAEHREGRPAGSVADLLDGSFVAVAPEDTVGEAVERLAAAGSEPALVVDYGRLIGVLAPHDVLRAVAARVHPSDARVREWMGEPVTIPADATPDEAATLMVQAGVHHAAVVGAGERPLGVLPLRSVVAGVPARR